MGQGRSFQCTAVVSGFGFHGFVIQPEVAKDGGVYTSLLNLKVLSGPLRVSLLRHVQKKKKVNKKKSVAS